MPILKTVYFGLAMLAFFWLLANYVGLNIPTVLNVFFAACYSILTIASAINAARGNRFLRGASIGVLSIGARRLLHVIGLVLPVPALIYCATFAALVATFDYGIHDVSCHTFYCGTPARTEIKTYNSQALDRIEAFKRIEFFLFGKSVINGYVGLPPDTAEESGPPASSPELTYDVDLSGYLAKMQARITKAWSNSNGNSYRQVVVHFQVSRGGSINELCLRKSSGDAAADRNALLAVKNASPFEPLPRDGPPSLEINIEFCYNGYVPPPYCVGTKEVDGGELFFDGRAVSGHFERADDRSALSSTKHSPE
jgi:TonB family protein